VRNPVVRSVLVAVAAVASLLLVACNGDADHLAAGADPAPLPATTTASASSTTSLPVTTPSQPYPFGQVQAKVPPIADGKAPVVSRITTDKPYVFITMDDGAIRDPQALQLIKESGARPTLFLNDRYVKGHEDYFRQLRDADNLVIGNHTVNHPDLRRMSYAAQKKEICDNSDAFEKAFGQRPTLFRPPYGEYNDNTLRAVADCGLKAVVLWTASVNDGRVDLQIPPKLRHGDIVLMHFRKTFAQDYTAFVDRAKQDGLTPTPLSDFLA
jgi:peptidoglycan/xylan/chitin deacetylase (PgdA/CDA1 family)